MAKRVFFSFHYQDVADLRANVVRKHDMTKPDREDAGFFDASIWESAKKTGETALKRLINGGLENTSVTCVLIGSETFSRPWVRYEILKSFKRGNKIIAVHINSVKGKDGKTKPLGPNPLDYVGVHFSADGKTATLSELIDGKWQFYDRIDGSSTYEVNVEERFRDKGFRLSAWYPSYDWSANDGYKNFPRWVES